MKVETVTAYLASKKNIRGKKALQKLIYFCKESGIPLDCSYRMHLYGPYSHEVAQELHDLIEMELLKEDNQNMGFTQGTACEAYLKQHEREIETYRNKLDAVLERFGSFSPFFLELYATTHFIATARYQTYGTVTKQEVVMEVRQAKGNKFTNVQIESAYLQMQEWGMLPPDGEA